MYIYRGFKSHASPGNSMDFHPEVKYVVVFRDPEVQAWIYRRMDTWIYIDIWIYGRVDI